MSKKPKANFNIRYVVDRVRFNVTTTLITLVTLSVGTLGLIMWASVGTTIQDELISQEILTSTTLSAETKVVAQAAANETKDALRSRLRHNFILYTPVMVVVSGLIAYGASRYILRPIRRGQRLQQRFIQDAAHELRNPLAAVKATIQSLRARENPSQADISRTLDSVERQLAQLININQGLLFLGEYKSRSAQDTSLSELLRDIIEDLHPSADDKNITIRTAIAEDVHYKISVDDFVQLARNLIENAIKYSPVNSKPIDVVLTQTAYRTRLKIKDHGQGIPVQETKLITQRFYRGSNVQQQEGTGLGMSIVQKIVDTYGGNIRIKSREAGDGTIVTITL